jgi:RNA polymerase sigma factor (sigma-70 family)
MATAHEPAEEDNSIIDLIRNGPADKMNSLSNVLYKKYWPSIFNLVRKNAGSEDQAKDIYQESWMAMYWKAKNNSDFKLTCDLGTYLYSICKNKLRQQWDKQGKANRLQDTLSKEDSNFVIETFDEQEQEPPPIEKVVSVIETMTGCYCVLINFYYYKLSMEEVARKCGLAGEGAAKQKKFKCINRLKEKMK